MRVLAALALLALFAAFAQAAPSGYSTGAVRADVLSYSPNWATLTQVAGDLRQFTVNGCGFRTYSQVSCIWGSRWASVKSYIVSDTQIVCEIPTIDPTTVETVPFWVNVQLVFDGDYTLKFDLPAVAPTGLAFASNFRFGPSCTGVAPVQAATGGGAAITISGQGMNEFTTADVYFDGQKATGTTSATGLTTSLPTTLNALYYNAYVMVNIVFNGNARWQLHCEQTIHLGPVITSISPSCGLSLDGLQQVTITGVQFDDPANTGSLIGTSPNVEVEWTNGAGNIQRTVGTRSGNSVTVSAAKYGPGCAIPGNVAVRVIFEWSFLRIALPFAAFYGSSNVVTYGPSVDASTTTGLFAGTGGNVGYVVQSAAVATSDLLSLKGCGFKSNNYTDGSAGSAVTVAVKIGAATCSNVNVVSDSLLTCIYPTVAACTVGQTVTATFTLTKPTTSSCGTITWLTTFDQRPNVVAIQTPTTGVPGFPGSTFQRGPAYVTTTPVPANARITFTGDHLCRNKDGCATGATFAPSCYFTEGSGPGFAAEYRSVVAGSYSDTSFACDAPLGKWNTNTVVRAAFFATSLTCAQGTFTWHYGPMCWSIAPTFGGMLGGNGLVLTGAGFADVAGWTAEVYMCNTRIASIGAGISTVGNFPYLTPKTGATTSSLCPQATTGSVADTSISVTTPLFPATFNVTGATKVNINPAWSGIRLFGDNARIVVTLGLRSEQWIECLRDWSGTPVTNDATANRWDYRWGPIVDNITPHKAEAGPTFGAYKPVPLTVAGRGFSDGYVKNRIMVGITTTGSTKTFGLLHNAGASAGDTSITFQSLWGGSTNMYQDITVYFDTCNSSVVMTASGGSVQQTISWGPTITGVSYTQTTAQPATYNVNDLCTTLDTYTAPGTTTPVNLNIWGVKPWGGELITVLGLGFAEFTSAQTFCVIDQVQMAATVVDDTKITCRTPARDYWTQATVVVQFGLTKIQGVSDYTRWLRARQLLNYRPCVSSLSATVGFVGTAEAVTLNGYGMLAWNDPSFQTSGVNTTGGASALWPVFTQPSGYLCFFSNYKGSNNGLPTAAPTETTIECTTPGSPKPTTTATTTGGVEFNTDVYVSVTLYNAPARQPFTTPRGQQGIHVGPNVIPMDWRVWAPVTFHFGPICTGVTPSYGYINLQQPAPVVLNGLKIADTNTIFMFRPTYNGANMTGWKANTDGSWTATSMSISAAEWKKPFAGKTPAACDQQPVLGMQFRLYRDHTVLITNPKPNPGWAIDVSISCPKTAFTYGPTVTGWTATWTGTTANGWIGSIIQVNGAGFTTDVLGTPKVSFGAAGFGTIGAVTATTIAVTAPGDDLIAGRWANPYVSLVLSFTNVTCTRAVGSFTYGPEICRITPTVTYSTGNQAPGTKAGTAGTPEVITLTGRGFSFPSSVVTGPPVITAHTATWSLTNGAAPAPVALTGAADTTRTMNAPSSVAVQNVGTVTTVSWTIGGTVYTRSGSAPAATCGATNSFTLYYGPEVATTTVYSRIAGNTLLSITGDRLNDAFFRTNGGTPATTFTWVKLGSSVFTPAVTVAKTSITFATILWGGKSCLDTEMAQPVFTIDTTGGATAATCTGTCLCTAPQYCMTPSTTVVYGNPNAFMASGPSNARVRTDGTDSAGATTPVTVTVNDYTLPAGGCGALFPGTCQNGWADYLDDNFGTALGGARVLCRFGNFYSTPTATPTFTGAVCPVPPGPFNYVGAVTVYLAPNNDAFTTQAKIFRWVPWSDRVSTPFAQENTYHTVVVYGGDWVNYRAGGQESINCYFGGVQAVQADMTDDYFVTCRTPMRGLGSAPISLDFCDHAGDNKLTSGDTLCTCAYSAAYPDKATEADSTTSTASFTFAGVSAISPVSGPTHGNTVVSVSGAGFQYLTGITCNFGGQSVAASTANGTASSSFTCTTGKASAAVVPFSVKGTYMGQTYTLTGPQCYEFGTPQTTDVSPSSIGIDAASTVITISGVFFNGAATFGCQVTGTGANAGISAKLTGTKGTDNVISCTITRGQITAIGSYIVEATLDGVATTDRQRVDFTQTPVPSSFTPTSGSLFGGDAIVVTGNSFNGGSAYFCRFDGKFVTAGTFTAGTQNVTTAGNSTIGAARRSESVEERRRPFSMSQRASLRGVGDKIACITAPGKVNTAVSVAISLDGINFVNAPGTFSYRDVNPGSSSSTSPSTKSAVVCVALAVATLVASLAM